MSYSVQKKKLHRPPLEEVCAIWKSALRKNFEEADVEVVDCPDLTTKEWGLAAPGLCGSPKVGEVGGIPYFLPTYDKNKYYHLDDALKSSGVSDGLIIGASLGPYKSLGRNAELIVNERFGSTCRNESKVAMIANEGIAVHKLPACEKCFALILDFYACEGKSGPVLKVFAKKRTGTKDLITCLREALIEAYGDKPVGFGGTFKLHKGSVKVHVAPEFSSTPFDNVQQLFEWLKYYDIVAPLVFMSVAISVDPQLQMNLQHSHGTGPDSGGHYEYDVTPEEVEYSGYFNIAEEIVRVDEPPSSK